MFGPCCTGTCCGPGSYCCANAGPHDHDDEPAHTEQEPPQMIPLHIARIETEARRRAANNGDMQVDASDIVELFEYLRVLKTTLDERPAADDTEPNLPATGEGLPGNPYAAIGYNPEATLALAYEQRTANLIALARLHNAAGYVSAPDTLREIVARLGK